MSALNTLEEPVPGVWLVRFASRELATGEGCEHLLPTLLDASKRSPIVLLAGLPPDVNSLPVSLAPFWLNAMLVQGLRVKAIGVLTSSRAVRVVTQAFQAAMKLRENPIGAEVFSDEAAMITWARNQ